MNAEASIEVLKPLRITDHLCIGSSLGIDGTILTKPLGTMDGSQAVFSFNPCICGIEVQLIEHVLRELRILLCCCLEARERCQHHEKIPRESGHNLVTTNLAELFNQLEYITR